MISTFRPNAPTIFADVDRTKAYNLKVPMQSVFDTLQAYLGSTYVNDFNEFGRTWHVTIQGDAKFRTVKEDIERLDVRNSEGNMIPMGTLLKFNETSGPFRTDRYNIVSGYSFDRLGIQGSARTRPCKPWRGWLVEPDLLPGDRV